MVSAFISREFGLGLGRKLSDDDLKKINDCRKGKEYTVPECADLVGISVKKDDNPITEDRLIEFFEYGKDKDGYWRSEHAAIQLEDALDCLLALFCEKYKFIFLFDNSSGHLKTQSNGLNVNRMNLSYGGIQTEMRKSKIVHGCYGAHTEHRTVLEGQEYSHLFDEDSCSGPIWMLSHEQEFHKNIDRDHKYVWKSKEKIRKVVHAHVQTLSGGGEEDTGLVLTGTETLDRLRYLAIKYDLIDTKELVPCNVKVKEVSMSHKELEHILCGEGLGTKGSTRVLKQRCTTHGIATTKQFRTGLFPHWNGKAKGLKQVCVERGLVPLQKILGDEMSMKGKKDDAGNIITSTSYIELLKECKDFKEEESILEKIVSSYGAEMWFTPKYHCELAGEGIEYAWGFMKSRYRRIPVAQKKKKEDFEKCVRNDVSFEEVSVERTRRFSRRARRYITAYFVLHGKHDGGQENNDMSFSKIEGMVKSFKTHRCALDFDYKFIDAEVRRDE